MSRPEGQGGANHEPPIGDRLGGPERPQDADHAKRADRAEDEAGAFPHVRVRVRIRARPRLRLVERIHEHQQREHRPEKDIVPFDQERAADPEPLEEVQEPCHQERECRREHERPRVAEPAQPKEGRVVEDLHHEVFPVDIDAPPEVGEARREEVAMMRFREVEPEEVQHADDEMKLPRDAHVQQEGRNHVEGEVAEISHGDGIER